MTPPQNLKEAGATGTKTSRRTDAVRGGQNEHANAGRPTRCFEKIHTDRPNAPVTVSHPVIGRDDEIRRAIQVVAPHQNNPVLIGEPGG